MELLPVLRDWERKNTIPVEINAPMQAANGNVHLPTLKLKVAPKAK